MSKKNGFRMGAYRILALVLAGLMVAGVVATLIFYLNI